MRPLFERSSHIALGLVALGLALFALAPSAEAQARTFRITRGGGSRIQWVSDAPLERVTGISSGVSGELTVDPSNLSSARGRVNVQVATMRTGIDLRDRHLRGPDWLDATAHPESTLEITAIEGATALAPNSTQRVTIRGRFSLHGITRDITASAQVRYIPLNDELRAQGVTGDVIRGQASFEIQLSDYEVSISAPVRLKVSNTIRVNVTIRAVAS